MYELINNPVHLWNKKAGLSPEKKFSPEYWKALDNQAARLMEELKETIAAIKSRDAVALLDGQVDLDFVLQGLTYLSQFDHQEAFKRVCDNNDLKITEDFNEALSWMEQHSCIEPSQGFFIVSTEVDGKTHHSLHRESDNKVIKPLDHPTVVLSDLAQDGTEIFVPYQESCVMCKNIIHNLAELGYKYTLLDIRKSKADAEFAEEMNLDLGTIGFYDGARVHSSYGGIGKEYLSNWLKGVGANGKSN